MYTAEEKKDENVLLASISFPVVVDRMHPCNLFQLIGIDELSLGYQSHNGFYSLTYDPDKSVSNIA